MLTDIFFFILKITFYAICIYIAIWWSIQVILAMIFGYLMYATMVWFVDTFLT